MTRIRPASIPTLSEEQRGRLIDAIRAGVDRATAARFVSLDPSAIGAMFDADPDLRSAIEAAEAAARVANVGIMAKAAKGGSVPAAQALLDRSRRRLTAAEIDQRRLAAIKHGARSARTVTAAARAQRRRFLRQMGLRAGDLNGIGRGLLDVWARAQAKVNLLDAHAEVYGWVDEDGNLPGFAGHYTAALNTAARTLEKLDAHLRAHRDEVDDNQLDKWRPRVVS